uniref:DWNN domain-containing protein n=1 Tax=Parastrongyloides trichosuri TaxID=131310 RepID=A0A0N4ZEK2_PARTI
MSSIHYKFWSSIDYKILQIPGLSIKVNNLKAAIFEAENIRSDLFDLKIFDAHTNKEYLDDEVVRRNNSVAIKRIPRNGGTKLPKLLDSNVYGDEGKNGEVLESESLYNNVDYANMTEDEKIAHMKKASGQEYQPSNYAKKGVNQSGVPPPSYICNRCFQPGHWYKMCPMLNTKRTTGIPTEDLMETTKDDPMAMLHPSGKYVIPIMHWKARNEKNNSLGNTSDTTNKVKDEEEDKKPKNDLPSELVCPLCDSLFVDAVLTYCCGNTFCADCLTKIIIEDKEGKCPGISCNQKKLNSSSFVPNKKVREAVKNYMLTSAKVIKDAGNTTTSSDSSSNNVSIKEEFKKDKENSEDDAKSNRSTVSPPKVVRIDLSNPVALAMNSKITAEKVLDRIKGSGSPIEKADDGKKSPLINNVSNPDYSNNTNNDSLKNKNLLLLGTSVPPPLGFPGTNMMDTNQYGNPHIPNIPSSLAPPGINPISFNMMRHDRMMNGFPNPFPLVSTFPTFSQFSKPIVSGFDKMISSKEKEKEKSKEKDKEKKRDKVKDKDKKEDSKRRKRKRSS